MQRLDLFIAPSHSFHKRFTQQGEASWLNISLVYAAPLHINRPTSKYKQN